MSIVDSVLNFYVYKFWLVAALVFGCVVWAVVRELRKRKAARQKQEGKADATTDTRQ